MAVGSGVLAINEKMNKVESDLRKEISAVREQAARFEGATAATLQQHSLQLQQLSVQLQQLLQLMLEKK